jgi:hypothetical protein
VTERGWTTAPNLTWRAISSSGFQIFPSLFELSRGVNIDLRLRLLAIGRGNRQQAVLSSAFTLFDDLPGNGSIGMVNLDSLVYTAFLPLFGFRLANLTVLHRSDFHLLAGVTPAMEPELN